MPTHHQHAKNYITRLTNDESLSEIQKRLQPHNAPQLRTPTGNTVDAFNKRWEMIDLPQESKSHLVHEGSREEINVYTKNIENFLGTVKIPVGLAGPLR